MCVSEEELIAEFIGEKEKRGLDRQTSHQAKSPLKTQLSIDKVPGVLEEEEEQDKKKVILISRSSFGLSVKSTAKLLVGVLQKSFCPFV